MGLALPTRLYQDEVVPLPLSQLTSPGDVLGDNVEFLPDGAIHERAQGVVLKVCHVPTERRVCRRQKKRSWLIRAAPRSEGQDDGALT